MAKKKTTRKKATKSSVTKKTARKAPRKRATSASASRAKKGAESSSAQKRKTKKKKAKSKVRRKATKVERNATRGTRRKPETNKKEIRDFFGLSDLSEMKPKEIENLKLVFLRQYARHGIVSDGTLAAGITYRIVKRWRGEDEAFNEGCKDAEAMANDLMEREARRRAIDGFDRPVIYQGEVTDSYTDYSDSLLTTLMKGNRPEKYKDKTEHSGSIGRPLTLDDETKEDVVSSILGMIVNKPDPD